MSAPARTTSIARSMVWSSWWRHLLAYVVVNLAIVGALLACFVVSCNGRAAAEGLPAGNLAWRHAASPLYSVIYRIDQVNGEFIAYPFADYVAGLWFVLAVVVAAEVLSLLVLPFSTRRVRRKLQPLNDLAVAAEELGSASTFDLQKMESLERAIQTASVDSPHVSTGDKDLQSIEVALNGLLRRMHEAKLQQMRFVSDASHELRTPISVIKGYVDMLDRWGKVDEAVLDESIAALKAEAEHMQELVEQLLFLARGDSGRNVLRHERFNLAEVMQEVWEESRMIDPAHVYTFDVQGSDVHAAAFELVGDAGMLKQVARVLMQNAAAYSADGTPIALAVKTRPAPQGGTEVLFSVQDEGMGMAQEDVPHVFERFYRADEARDRRAGGAGLGLAIAKWIVDAHGGRIEVLSCEGVGTRFTVVL